MAFAGGAGLRDLGRRMNIPAGTVLARAKREGWSRQIQEVKALVSSSPSAITPLRAVSESLADAGAQTRAMLSQALIHAAGQARKTKHPLERAKQIQAVTNAAAKVHGWETKVKVSGSIEHVLTADERARRLEQIIEKRAKAREINCQKAPRTLPDAP